MKWGQELQFFRNKFRMYIPRLRIMKNFVNTVYEENRTIRYSTWYRGFSPYATFGTWIKFALAKNRISQILVIALKNRSNEIRSNENRIRRELPVLMLCHMLYILCKSEVVAIATVLKIAEVAIHEDLGRCIFCHRAKHDFHTKGPFLYYVRT